MQGRQAAYDEHPCQDIEFEHDNSFIEEGQLDSFIRLERHMLFGCSVGGSSKVPPFCMEGHHI